MNITLAYHEGESICRKEATYQLAPPLRFVVNKARQCLAVLQAYPISLHHNGRTGGEHMVTSMMDRGVTRTNLVVMFVVGYVFGADLAHGRCKVCKRGTRRKAQTSTGLPQQMMQQAALIFAGDTCDRTHSSYKVD